MQYPRNIMPIYSFDDSVLLEKHAELNGEWLSVLDDSLDAEYQIPTSEITHVINFSNANLPSGYYRMKYKLPAITVSNR